MEKRGDAELSSDDFRNINSYYRIALERAGLKSESNAAINKTIQEIVAEQLETEVPEHYMSPLEELNKLKDEGATKREIRTRMGAVRYGAAIREKGDQERKQVIPDLDVPRNWAGGEIKQSSLLSRAS